MFEPLKCLTCTYLRLPYIHTYLTVFKYAWLKLRQAGSRQKLFKKFHKIRTQWFLITDSFKFFEDLFGKAK